MKTLLVAVGALITLVGLVWTLQGLDILGGSAMSGQTMWAVIGPIVAIIGIAVIVVARRGRRSGA
jgi:drug/metabolite transporter superfamily protein YnfA